MDQGNINNSSTPSSEDDVQAKRQKLEKIISAEHNLPDNHSPRASEWERTYLLKELMAHRTNLSNTEASALQLHRMRAEMERALVEKEQMLAIQVRVDRETIKNLEFRLEAIKKSTPEGKEPQLTPKTEESSMKSKIRETMDSLFDRNPILPKNSMASSSGTTPASPKPEEWTQIKLEEVFQESLRTQGSNPESTPPEEIHMQSQESKSVNLEEVIQEEDGAVLVEQINELEEQLQSAENIIPTLGEVVKEISIPEEKVSIVLKRLDVAEGVWQCVLPDNHEESSSGIDKNEATVKRTLSSASKAGTSSLQQSGDSLEQEDHQEEHEISKRTRSSSRIHKKGLRGSETSSAASKPGTSSLVQKAGTSRQEEEDQMSLHDRKEAYEGCQRIRRELKRINSDMMKKAREFDTDAVKNQSSSGTNGPSHDLRKKGRKKLSSSNQSSLTDQNNCSVTVNGFQIWVSSQKFFTTKWEKYYHQTVHGMFACTKCSEDRTSRSGIEDHVWTRHLGGSFMCPSCPEHSNTLLTRCNIRRHMEQYHPSKSFSKNPRDNEVQKIQRSTQQALKKIGNAEESEEIDQKSSKGPSERESSPTLPSQENNQNCELNHNDFKMLVSSPKFFTIQWNKYYEKTSSHYSCKKCSKIGRYRVAMEDHVWVSHCGGTFHCSRCNSQKSFNWRSNIVQHMRNCHSKELCTEK